MRAGEIRPCKALSSPEKPLGALKRGNGKNSFSAVGLENIHSMIQFSHNTRNSISVYSKVSRGNYQKSCNFAE
jgi:hypothetical protein